MVGLSPLPFYSCCCHAPKLVTGAVDIPGLHMLGISKGSALKYIHVSPLQLNVTNTTAIVEQSISHSHSGPYLAASQIDSDTYFLSSSFLLLRLQPPYSDQQHFSFCG